MADNRYRITERVAAGGMAEVFRGVAESMRGFKKNIAIKRILPALTKNKKFVAMFLDEARLSLSLQHANIVQVFDIGHTEDTYFIVMEYVDGVDLKAILDWRRRIGKRIPIAHSLYVIMEICKGLSYAHELTNPENEAPLGIVHRDISPPNVLISKQGEIKVVDFGLAKATSQVEMTDPGVVKGKMSYLSPEAARGEEVDSRADIFAVGILLYEMLTGKRLFYGETDYQTVELVRNAKIPPLRPQNPQVEPELEDIVRKALAKRKEDRFQSATDLQDALAQYSYSRGLKVISRDIAELVRQCLEDKRMQSGEGKRAQHHRAHPAGRACQVHLGRLRGSRARSRSPPTSWRREPSRRRRRADGDFVDPRGWADERHAIRRWTAPRCARSSHDGPRATRRSRPRRSAPPRARRTDARSRPGRTAAAAEIRRPSPRPPSRRPAPKRWPASSSRRPARRRRSAARRRCCRRPRAAQASSSPGRSFLIGAVIGTVLLGAAVAVVVSRRGGVGRRDAAPDPAGAVAGVRRR